MVGEVKFYLSSYEFLGQNRVIIVLRMTPILPNHTYHIRLPILYKHAVHRLDYNRHQGSRHDHRSDVRKQHILYYL